MNILECAISYCKRGFSVIPIKPRDKRPAVQWREYQSRMPTQDELSNWFKEGKNNIAIVTGKISGLTVVDCDSNESILESLDKGIPECLSVKTANGQHFYFKYEEGVGNFQARDDLPGVDLRSQGGYVLAPPSIHPSGKRYEWTGDSNELPSLPKWVLPTRKERKPNFKQLYKGVTETHRNMSLARLAGVWVKSLNLDECYDVAQEWNKLNVPPMSNDELRTTIKSIYGSENKHSSKEIGDGEIITFQDFINPLLSLYETGLQRGKSTGWLPLDEYYTVRKGEFTLVTGIPGHGKTEWLDAFLVNMMMIHKWKFGVFSVESLPYERHGAGYLERYYGVPFRKGFKERMTMNQVSEGAAEMNDKIFFVNPNEKYFTLDRILKISEKLVQDNGIDALFIDPWNELDHERLANMNETEYISQSLSKIRRAVRSNNIHIFLVAHPTKLQKDKKGKYPVPTPYDISGSAHWRNKADNCISIWRDYERPGSTQIHVQKVRFKEVGSIGSVELKYDILTGRFS